MKYEVLSKVAVTIIILGFVKPLSLFNVVYCFGSGYSARTGTLVSNTKIPVNKSDWLHLTRDSSVGINAAYTSAVHCDLCSQANLLAVP